MSAYALSFQYGQRHATELDAARRIAEAAGVGGHVVAEIDLRVFGGSALTADIDVPKGRSDGEMGAGIPVTYVPARNTIFLSFALAYAETLGASDIFVGVNALDYSGYPDCRPEYIEAFERMANLATKAGVEGTQRLQHPRAADAAHEGGHHPPRARARRRLLGHAELLRPGCGGSRVRRVRCLLAAAARLRRGRRTGSRSLPAGCGGAAMTYAVKEIFYTLQGEGANTGRPAVFCRFAGCNLWSGHEKDRATAVCTFCDTDFVGTDGPDGGKFRTAAELAAAVAERWPRANGRSRPLVVCTGGEPLLQIDAPLVDALHAAGFEIAVETNGTLEPPRWDRLDLRQPQGRLETRAAARKRAQARLPAGGRAARALRRAPTSSTSTSSPWTGPRSTANIARTIEYCLAHPQWRLSLQTHKITGIR